MVVVVVVVMVVVDATHAREEGDMPGLGCKPSRVRTVVSPRREGERKRAYFTRYRLVFTLPPRNPV